MTVSYNLDESTIKEAVEFWLKSKGHIPEIAEPMTRLYQDPGDPPMSGPTINATVMVPR